MMRIGAALVLMLASCATADTSGGAAEGELPSELAGRTAGEARECIQARKEEPLRALDNQTVAYGRGKTLWVSRLRDPCPRLGPSRTLVVEVIGSRFCRGDAVGVVEPGSSMPGQFCALGDFVPYTRQ